MAVHFYGEGQIMPVRRVVNAGKIICRGKYNAAETGIDIFFSVIFFPCRSVYLWSTVDRSIIGITIHNYQVLLHITD